MLNKLLEGLAEFSVERRIFLIGAFAVLGILAALELPSLPIDPSPRALFASLEDQEQLATQFRRDFGSTDNVIVLLLSGKNVLRKEALEYIHLASTDLGAKLKPERVESLTVTPLPHRPTEASAEVSLDELEEAPELAETELFKLPPDALDAISLLVRSDPKRFPLGLASLADHFENGPIEVKPTVEGKKVTEEHVEAIREAIALAPLVEGRLISRDRSATLVAFVLSDARLGHKDANRTMIQIRTWLEAHPAPAGFEVSLSGLPYVRAVIVDHMRNDQTRLLPLTLAMCVVILAFAFRWFPAVALPVLSKITTIVLVLGAMAFFHEPLNVLNNVLPPLLLIIGVSDTVQFVTRYRDEVAIDGDNLAAGRRTVRAMAAACFLSAATAAVGLASLAVSETPMLRRFGVTAGIGVMISYLVTIFFLSAMLVNFRPKRTTTEGRKTSTRRDPLENLVVGVTACVLRRPWRVLAGGLLLLIVVGAVATRVRPDHALLDQFDKDDPVYKTTRVLETKLEGIRPLEVVLVAKTKDELDNPKFVNGLDELTRWAKGRTGVLGATSFSDYLHEAWYTLVGEETARAETLRTKEQIKSLKVLVSRRKPNPLRAYISNDGLRARVRIRLADIGARATLNFVEDLEAKIRKTFGNGSKVQYHITGDAYMTSRGLDTVVRDLLWSLATTIPIIFVLIAILFRSLRLAALSIPTNVIPLVFTMAWMVIRGIPLNTSTTVIFSLSIGLAVNGTIYLLARCREEAAKNLGTNVALIRAARGTGRAIVIATATLILGFSVLLLSSFVPVRHFAELLAVTFVAALFATLLLQPALLRIAGRSALAK